MLYVYNNIRQLKLMRKNIDINDDDAKVLRVLAAYQDKDLKNYIQDLLSEIAKKAIEEGKISKDLLK